MAHLELPLIRRTTIAENTIEIAFAKPADLSFQPGQYMQLILPTSAGLSPKESIRLLSMASSPSDSELTFAFRQSSSEFKKYIASVPLYTHFALRGPFGYFTLDQSADNPLIFLAGGIGITPFISMMREYVKQKEKREITLLYTNIDEQKAAYISELKDLTQKNPSITLKTIWGRIGWKEILETNFTTKHFWYIAGSTNMVSSAGELLLEHDVPPYKIHTELFTGETEEGCQNCTCGKRPMNKTASI